MARLDIYSLVVDIERLTPPLPILAISIALLVAASSKL